MKMLPRFLFCTLLPSLAWAQISKDQLYEMTEKGLDETVIVSLVEKNCVDFELDGQMIVELSSRVTPEVLRTVVDCVRAQEKEAGEVEVAATEVLEEAEKAEETPLPAPEPLTAVATSKAEKILPNLANAISLPSFINVEIQSNKGSYTIADLEMRLVTPDNPSTEDGSVRYQFSGKAKAGESIRCYRPSGDVQLVPGEYVAFLHVVSERKKGLRGKTLVRTDLHKFRVEFKGPGPISIEYFSKEGKNFKAGKAPTIKVHGPMSFFGEQHVSVDSRKNLENLTSLIGDASNN